MTCENTNDSPDFCPGCRRCLDEISLTEVQNWHGSIELIFCECGTALDLRTAISYVIDQ